jgi:preprotein translocase subunit SecE
LEKSVAEQTGGRKKRLVKNPETFRERALKAGEAGDKPSKRSRLKSIFSKVLSPVGRLFKVLGRFLARFKALRFIGRIILPRYLRTSWQELKQVKWPNWQESRRLTFAVILFAVVFGALIAAVDFGLDKLFRNILLK